MAESLHCAPLGLRHHFAITLFEVFMPSSAKVLHILIAEAEPWTADLLLQLVRDVRPDARIHLAGDGEAALAQCQKRWPALVIADGELPVVDGLELLRQLRRMPRGAQLPFVLISGRLDVHSVRAARPLAPAAYLAKPFNAEKLRQRLQALLGSANTPNSAPALPTKSLDDYLDTVREDGQGAPLLAEVRDAVSRCLNGEDYDLRQLERLFVREPQITARLIAAANSAAQHHGSPCQTLRQALPRLGVAHTLNLVLGLAIQRNVQLKDPRLTASASAVYVRTEQSADLAHWLANELQLDADLCFTAGLLHNIGELALLRSLQDWLDAGGDLSDDDIAQQLRRRAAGFGSALRIQWRLPIGLRELIAAFYNLGSGVFSREALVLNLVSELLNLGSRQPHELLDSRCARLLRIDVGLLKRLPLRPADAQALGTA
jgi:HD-like signal output (HDOD) protein/CheY-like chemotaxis protein